MILYQASLSLAVLKRYYELFHEPLNVLLSVALIGNETYGFLKECRHMVGKIVADSGAWSVAKGTSSLTLEQVISYLRQWGKEFDHYFNFDTDFSEQGFEHNIANQTRMERAGLKPIPVVHNFFKEEIDYYINSGNYSWLALGSSQSSNFDDFKYAIDQIKKGNPQIKIHWFGGSSYEWLIKTPVASCDTSSWAKAGKYGYIHYWNEQRSGVNKTDRIYVGGYLKDQDKGNKAYDYVDYPYRKQLEEYLYEKFKLRYSDLWGYEAAFNMQLVNTRFYAELEARVNQERIKNGIPLE
jgi:hypothetical protein